MTFAEPGKLAALFRRYMAEVDAFNTAEDMSDEEFHAEQAFDATLLEMVGVPVGDDDDALAAVEWIIHSGDGSVIEPGGESIYSRVTDSLLHALRSYHLDRRVSA